MSDDRMASRRAALAVLYCVASDARMMGLDGSVNGIRPNESQQLAHMMDVIHNLPDLLQHWDDFEEEMFVSDLQSYDAKWNQHLLDVYQEKRFAG